MVRDLAGLVTLFEQAANRHNLEALAALFTEDAEYELLGQDVLRGAAQLRALHAYDAGLNTVLEIADCSVDGDTVTCRMVEHNEWLAAAGLGPIVYHRATFTFAGDRIAKLTVAMDEEKVEEIGEVLHEFTPWLMDTYPREASRLFTEGGDFVYSRENGELVVRLLREWRGYRG